MKIKSYYLTDKDIIVRYQDKTERSYELNQINLKKLINKIDEENKINKKELDSKLDNLVDLLIKKLGVCLLVELLITSVIFMSFVSGSYIGLILSLMMLFSWFYYITKISITEIKELLKSVKYEKIYEGRMILVDTYNSLSDVTSTTNLLDVSI